MITGLLLFCVLSTNDCTVNVSRTFFDNTEKCTQFMESIRDEVNSEEEELDFFIADIKCVNWNEKNVYY